jgi:hypothetical protein
MKRGCRRSEFVVSPQALLSFLYQPGPEEVSQMAGSPGLWHAGDADNIADAHFAIDKEMQNSQACAIGESAEHEIDI